MGLSDDFKTFCGSLWLKNKDDMEKTVGAITEKLNKSYYDSNFNKTDHSYIVGSVGRGTAINGASDLDFIFDLPSSTYERFNKYESNGQSALLQEVKNILKERYPKTQLSGDGQVVVIEFSSYTVELVPGFKLLDGSFKYPDTHDGGTWKITNPLPEIQASYNMGYLSGGNYLNVCHMLRAWKNKKGFNMGGLLIDTLVYNFFMMNGDYKYISFDSYLSMLKDLFLYLKGLDKKQKYWYALGSSQQVYNCDNGKFIDEAGYVYEKIKDLIIDSEDVNDVLRDVFGRKFPKAIAYEEDSLRKAIYEHYYGYKNTEEFIEDKVPVDIRYSLNIECVVSQDGWRDKLLRIMLRNNEWLSINKRLQFYIEHTNVPIPYEIYWKVKNEGEEAEKRDAIRGQILKTNKTTQIEGTNFRGEHYVECYIIKNGVCVARDKIKVPISTY